MSNNLPLFIVEGNGVISIHCGELIRLVDSNPSKTTLRLFHLLMGFEGEGKPIPNQSELATLLNVSRQSISSAVAHLRQHGFWQERWGKEQEKDDIENQVRERLRDQYGGLAEVPTAVGRIDLLTYTEVIEVKHIRGWKAALGQVLAYSSLYPEHGKRIHLFYKEDDLPKKPYREEIEVICSALNVTVTFEEVQA